MGVERSTGPAVLSPPTEVTVLTAVRFLCAQQTKSLRCPWCMATKMHANFKPDPKDGIRVMDRALLRCRILLLTAG